LKKSRIVVGSLGLVVGAAGLARVRWRPFGVTVQGRSMEPVLRDGDRCLVIANAAIGPGDVVIARHPLYPGVEMVKRVRVAGGELGPFPEASIAGRVIAVFGPLSRARAVVRGPAQRTIG